MSTPRVDYDFFQRVAISSLEQLGLSETLHPGGRREAIVERRPDGNDIEHGWREDIGSAGDGEIATWGGHLAAWLDYAHNQKALASATRAQIEEHLAQRRAALAVRSRAQTVTLAKAQAESEPEVTRLRGMLLAGRTRTRLLDGIIAGLEVKRLAVKDEINRRQSAAWRQA